MLASTGPFRMTRFPRPGRLYGIDMPASAHGMTTQPLQAVSWSGERGASDAPKSTVRAVIWAIPAPDPVPEYVILSPSALSTAGIHFEMSGNGKVAPVPTSEPAVGFADADCVLPAKAASATTASTTSPAARRRFMILVPLSLRFDECLPLAPFERSRRSPGRAGGSFDVTLPDVCFAKVKIP